MLKILVMFSCLSCNSSSFSPYKMFHTHVKGGNLVGEFVFLLIIRITITKILTFYNNIAISLILTVLNLFMSFVLKLSGLDPRSFAIFLCLELIITPLMATSHV